MKEYDTKKIGITGSNPNLYAIKYLSLIEDMPFDAGGNIMFDTSVTFKQLVLHGSVSYVTSPLNLKDDFTSKVLQAVENGSGLQFVFTDSMNKEIYESDFSYYYGTEFVKSSSKAMEAVKTVNKALEGLNGVYIENHIKIGNVSRTIYENGTIIYVNHGDTDAFMDDITIKANSYLRK